MILGKSLGKNVLYLYLLTTYVFQYLYLFFFEDLLHERYRIYEYGAALFAINLFFAFLASKVRFGFSLTSNRKILLPGSCVLFLSFCFFLLALNFNLKFGLSFRHTQRVSDAGIQVMALYVLKPLVLYFIMRYSFVVARSERLSLAENLSVFLVFVGLILSITGSLQVLPIGLCFLLLFYPRVFEKDLNLVFIFKYFIPALFLAFATVFMGFANKVGISEAVALLLDNQSSIFNILIARTSSSFASGVILSVLSIEGYGSLQGLLGIIQTLAYRLDILLPFDLSFDGEYLRSINRINYETIMVDPSVDRAGASPGLIGSFLYLPLYPLPLAFLFIYLRFICWCLNADDSGRVGKKPLVVFCALIVVLPVLESPLSILNIVDPVSVSFFAIFIGRFLKLRRDCE